MLGILSFLVVVFGVRGFTEKDSVTSIEPPTTYYTIGSTVVLHCNTSGYPGSRYDWLKIKDSITSQLTPGHAKVDNVTGDLVLQNATGADQGQYVCVATRTGQADVTTTGVHRVVSWSSIQTLSLRRLDKFKLDSKTVTIKRPVHSHARLECTPKVKISGSDIKFKWFRLSEKGLSVVHMNDTRMFIDQTGSLHISQLLPDDDSMHTGTPASYVCSVSITTMPKANMGLLGHPQNLFIDNRHEAKVGKPSLVYRSKTQKVHIGRTAILECVFEGILYQDSDKLNISWRDNSGVSIENSGRHNISSGGRRLRIDGVREEDEGEYSCRGRNSNGTSDWYNIHLDVTSVPIWIRGGEPQDDEMVRGQDKVFPCSTRSTVSEARPQKPNWFVNGTPLKKLTEGIQWTLSSDSRHLTVDIVTGPLCVQCLVSNKQGQVLGNACLNVKESSMFPTKINGGLNNTKDSNINVSVSALQGTTTTRYEVNSKSRSKMLESPHSSTTNSDPKIVFGVTVGFAILLVFSVVLVLATRHRKLKKAEVKTQTRRLSQYTRRLSMLDEVPSFSRQRMAEAGFVRVELD